MTNKTTFQQIKFDTPGFPVIFAFMFYCFSLIFSTSTRDFPCCMTFSFAFKCSCISTTQPHIVVSVPSPPVDLIHQSAAFSQSLQIHHQHIKCSSKVLCP